MEETELQGELQLVERAKTDDAAFTELYRRYFPKIYGYIYRRVGHRQTAEDLTSTTFLKMVKALPTFQPQAVPFGAWVYRIATNTLTDHYRRGGRITEVELEPAHDVADPAPGADHVLDAGLERNQLEQILHRLRPRYAQVIQLKFFAELSNQEIAEVLQIKPNAVGVLLHRALHQAHTFYLRYVTSS